MRLSLLAVLSPASIVAFIATGVCAAIARGQVDIGFRPGGEIFQHVIEATAMIQSGKSYRVTGDQYSAAAMQVLFIESQFPDRICATRKAKLHFHLGFYPNTKQTMKKPDWVLTAFIRPENLKRLGKLPEFGKGFKTVKASDYLGLCETKTFSCNVVGCGD